MNRATYMEGRSFNKDLVSNLCSSYNNNTGNWYVKDFCNFTEQGMQI